MNKSQNWYIVKQSTGHCEIISKATTEDQELSTQKHWGPFPSQDEAIARRVGLIRSGKCQPV